MVKNAALLAGPAHIIFSVGLKHPSGSAWSCATRLWKTPHPGGGRDRGSVQDFNTVSFSQARV
ncbi:MAG: hypothetical protein DMG31_07335 [Acidobacteria bacterium]|nr:MAG: hypothetical protein DMG31_07335 [Acidobacteriota bacterium]